MENYQPGWDQSEASLNCESKTGELLLTWDNHRKNASEAFSSLRKDDFFCDVTLACQDQQFNAHKVVLAASSLFFEQVLQNHQHPNPLIYLKGVEVKHMEWLLDFMYCGEVSLQQVEVEDFLRAGEELSIKGLTVMVTPEYPCPPRKTFEISASPSMKINTSISSPMKVKTPLVKKINIRRKHTELSRLPCTHSGCSASFRSAAGLKFHLMDHAGERPFPCPYQSCGERFKSQGDVNKHIKKAKKHEGHRKASKIIEKYLLPFTCQVNNHEIGHYGFRGM